MSRPSRGQTIAANWKMNHGPHAARDFMRAFCARYTPQQGREIVIFPSALAFAAARDATGSHSPVRFGVQNVAAADKGAFTGENSAPIARDAGAELVLVGHSERRHVYGETDDDCAAKCAAVERAGLEWVLCVGETLEERERGFTAEVVVRQLRRGLGGVHNKGATRVIAYEPVWAIGTGRTATPEDASEIHGILRDALGELIGRDGERVRILYGGSVNPANAAELLSAPNIDGLLVGGASLDVDSWLSICTA